MEVSQVGRRTVQWSTEGSGDAVDVVFFHGTPQGWELGGSARDALLEAGARIIGIARPGYGASTRRRGRRVVDVVEDVRVVLQDADVTEFRALGWSGGGPHALAVAANVAGCVGVVLVAGVAPPGTAGWHDGMAEANVVEFSAAASGEAALRELIDPAAPLLAAITGEQLLDALGELLAPADRQALRRYAESDVLAAATRQALATGNDGHVDDDLAFVTDWGFDLDAVHVPVTIWHGEQDRMVPVRHARWLADRIERPTLRLTPEDGHLSIFLDHTDEIAHSLTA
jgi:pimeloyl-ACP methyl ester carboxylesterase